MIKGKRAGLLLGIVLPCVAWAYDPLPPVFPLHQGWLGGDGAYSVPLDCSNRVLWLFGDTYVRNDSVLDRTDANLVANTIAIRTSDGTSGAIAMQSEGGEWELRKIYIEPLPPNSP